MNRLWASALILSFVGSGASADDPVWRSRPPLVTVGRPIVVAPPPVIRGQSAEALSARPMASAVALIPGGRVIAVSREEAYNNGMVVSTSETAPPPTPVAPPQGVAVHPPGMSAAPVEPPFGMTGPAPGDDALFGCECLGSMGSNGRHLFESDNAFPVYISPVSSPFLFEDPRALTEVRPIFMYQHTPSSNYIFKGGNIDYFVLSLRLAVTDRLSFVVNKLGFVWTEPRTSSGIFNSDSEGFSELDFGGKYTFWRNEETKSLGAIGLTCQLPTGPARVFQNTGRASLVPYLSFATNFLESEWGSFNLLSTSAYAFAVDNRRTDYYYSGMHLDYDIANLHKIYPLVELNWYHYTSAGSARELGFEGRDLINFGSTGVSGISSLSIATGARYKFNERIQTGFAVEFPLTSAQDLVNFRLTWDVIFRY